MKGKITYLDLAIRDFKMALNWSKDFQKRYEHKLAERPRIANDLHDDDFQASSFFTSVYRHS
jgi:signal transduction histidine kinase